MVKTRVAAAGGFRAFSCQTNAKGLSLRARRYAGLVPTRVVNKYHSESYDVYVGRGQGSIWGNPFSHKEGTLAHFKVASQEEAVRAYERWIRTRPELMRRIPELRGRTLACFCRPKGGFQGRLLCHAQVLAALADGVRPEDVE